METVTLLRWQDDGVRHSKVPGNAPRPFFPRIIREFEDGHDDDEPMIYGARRR